MRKCQRDGCETEVRFPTHVFCSTECIAQQRRTWGPPESRLKVYEALNGERAYQEDQWPSSTEEPRLTVGEELLLIEEYVRKARAKWAKEGRPEIATLTGIRKIAGIAVRCMEQHGAPQREGY